MSSGSGQDLGTALSMFNEGLDRQKTEARARKVVEEAERAKRDAAAKVKRLQGDTKASAEDRAAAEAEYRAAVDELNRRRAGDTDTDTDTDEDMGDPSDAAAADAEAASGDSGDEGADASNDAADEAAETS